jgi:uncharacterized protein YecE (DUF72 family)
MCAVFIGTSGWTYKDWRGSFFPSDIPVKRWLGWYATQFRSTEINGSFYRTPTLDAVQAWRDQTPDEFVFAWKASKFITHWKRLSDKCRNSLDLLETRLEVLGPKTGPILFQLPPQFKMDRSMRLSFVMRAGTRLPFLNWEVTAKHVYIRGHGPTGQYKDHYSESALHRWAESIADWRQKRLSVYCYFDNDQKTAAPQDAKRLADLTAQG